MYLVPRDGVQGAPGVESPVKTRDIQYYDSGVWLTRDSEDGRIFFPYEQVRMIRERPDTADSEEDGPWHTKDTKP